MRQTPAHRARVRLGVRRSRQPPQAWAPCVWGLLPQAAVSLLSRVQGIQPGAIHATAALMVDQLFCLFQCRVAHHCTAAFRHRTVAPPASLYVSSAATTVRASLNTPESKVLPGLSFLFDRGFVYAQPEASVPNYIFSIAPYTVWVFPANCRCRRVVAAGEWCSCRRAQVANTSTRVPYPPLHIPGALALPSAKPPP